MRLINGQVQIIVILQNSPWDTNSEGDVQMSELFQDLLISMNEFIEYEKQEDCESDRIKLRVTEIEVEDLSLL